ncbi:MAG: hypothetical protein N2110_05875 [Flavobacteriales bacterium]|nr:hypothetical protein [Flavobacteriales bacterium]
MRKLIFYSLSVVLLIEANDLKGSPLSLKTRSLPAGAGTTGHPLAFSSIPILPLFVPPSYTHQVNPRSLKFSSQYPALTSTNLHVPTDLPLRLKDAGHYKPLSSKKKKSQAYDEQGYRGLIEAGVEFGVSFWATDRFKLNVINGYQFIPYLITSGGIGLRYFFGSNSVSFPIFLDLRGVFLETRVRPTAAFGIGYTLNSRFKGVGLYLYPQIGARYYLNDRMGLNLGLGYEVQRLGTGGILRLYSNAISINLGFSF